MLLPKPPSEGLHSDPTYLNRISDPSETFCDDRFMDDIKDQISEVLKSKPSNPTARFHRRKRAMPQANQKTSAADTKTISPDVLRAQYNPPAAARPSVGAAPVRGHLKEAAAPRAVQSESLMAVPPEEANSRNKIIDTESIDRRAIVYSFNWICAEIEMDMMEAKVLKRESDTTPHLPAIPALPATKRGPPGESAVVSFPPINPNNTVVRQASPPEASNPRRQIAAQHEPARATPPPRPTPSHDPREHNPSSSPPEALSEKPHSTTQKEVKKSEGADDEDDEHVNIPQYKPVSQMEYGGLGDEDEEIEDQTKVPTYKPAAQMEYGGLDDDDIDIVREEGESDEEEDDDKPLIFYDPRMLSPKSSVRRPIVSAEPGRRTPKRVQFSGSVISEEEEAQRHLIHEQDEEFLLLTAEEKVERKHIWKLWNIDMDTNFCSPQERNVKIISPDIPSPKELEDGDNQNDDEPWRTEEVNGRISIMGSETAERFEIYDRLATFVRKFKERQYRKIVALQLRRRKEVEEELKVSIQEETVFEDSFEAELHRNISDAQLPKYPQRYLENSIVDTLMKSKFYFIELEQLELCNYKLYLLDKIEENLRDSLVAECRNSFNKILKSFSISTLETVKRSEMSKSEQRELQEILRNTTNDALYFEAEGRKRIAITESQSRCNLNAGTLKTDLCTLDVMLEERVARSCLQHTFDKSRLRSFDGMEMQLRRDLWKIEEHTRGRIVARRASPFAAVVFDEEDEREMMMQQYNFSILEFANLLEANLRKMILVWESVSWKITHPKLMRMALQIEETNWRPCVEELEREVRKELFVVRMESEKRKVLIGDFENARLTLASEFRDLVSTWSGSAKVRAPNVEPRPQENTVPISLATFNNAETKRFSLKHTSIPLPTTAHVHSAHNPVPSRRELEPTLAAPRPRSVQNSLDERALAELAVQAYHRQFAFDHEPRFSAPRRSTSHETRTSVSLSGVLNIHPDEVKAPALRPVNLPLNTVLKGKILEF